MEPTIVPIEPEDFRDLHALFTRPDVADTLGAMPTMTAEFWRKRLEEDDADSVFRLKAVIGGRLVGVASIERGPRPRRAHSGRVSIAVAPEHQRRGVGRRLLGALVDAADRWLALTRLYLDVWTENPAAIGLYRALGFEQEARRRGGDMLRDGKPADALVMARLRPGLLPATNAPSGTTAGLPPRRDLPGEVRFRPVGLEDAPAIAALHRSEEVLIGTLQVPTTSARSWRRRLESMDPGSHHLLAAELGGEIVGITGLHGFGNVRLRHVYGVGLSVAAAYQGMGLGKRLVEAGVDVADRYLGARRLELEVFPDNVRAIQIYERAGFEHEGRLRSYAFRDGKLWDVLLMGRVR